MAWLYYELGEFDTQAGDSASADAAISRSAPTRIRATIAPSRGARPSLEPPNGQIRGTQLFFTKRPSPLCPCRFYLRNSERYLCAIRKSS